MSRYGAVHRTWNPKLPEVPVDRDGNWISYPANYNLGGWEVIHQPFFAVMTIDGMHVGRSAKNVILKDENGKTYPMFIADLVAGIQKGTLAVSSNNDGEPGTISAYWTGSKRGANYGIKAVNNE